MNQDNDQGMDEGKRITYISIDCEKFGDDGLTLCNLLIKAMSVFPDLPEEEKRAAVQYFYDRFKNPQRTTIYYPKCGEKQNQ